MKSSPRLANKRVEGANVASALPFCGPDGFTKDLVVSYEPYEKDGVAFEFDERRGVWLFDSKKALELGYIPGPFVCASDYARDIVDYVVDIGSIAVGLGVVALAVMGFFSS